MIKILKKETNEVLLEANNSRIFPNSIVFYDETDKVLANIINGIFYYSEDTFEGIKEYTLLDNEIRLEFVGIDSNEV